MLGFYILVNSEVISELVQTYDRVHSHGDLIVLPLREIKLLVPWPDVTLSHINIYIYYLYIYIYIYAHSYAWLAGWLLGFQHLI